MLWLYQLFLYYIQQLSLKLLDINSIEVCYLLSCHGNEIIHWKWFFFLVAGGPGIATSGCSVSLWDTRTSDRQIDATLDANLIYGLRAQGNELYVRDDLKYVSLHDMRMLKGLNVDRIPCGVNSELKLQESEDKWWDVDVACTNTDEDVDDDGEFWDCQSQNVEGKEMGKPSMVGNFVLAVSRSFSSKSLGR